MKLRYMRKVQVPKKYMNECTQWLNMAALQPLFTHTVGLRCRDHTCIQRHSQIVQCVILGAALLWYNSGLDTITISKSNGSSTTFASFHRLSTRSLLSACSVQHHKTPRWSNPYSEVNTLCHGVGPQHRKCFILTCCGLRALAWRSTRLTDVVAGHCRQMARLSLAS